VRLDAGRRLLLLPRRAILFQDVGDAVPVRIVVALKQEIEASGITKLEQLDTVRTGLRLVQA